MARSHRSRTPQGIATAAGLSIAIGTFLSPPWLIIDYEAFQVQRERRRGGGAVGRPLAGLGAGQPIVTHRVR